MDRHVRVETTDDYKLNTGLSCDVNIGAQYADYLEDILHKMIPVQQMREKRLD